jgi:chromosome segregation ATPase
MDTLDTLVVEHLSERLFTTERLTAILAATFARRAEKAVEVDRRVVSLQRDVTDAADKLKRLYRLVEEGIAELDDILTDRIASLKRDRERAQTALDRIQAQAAPLGEIPLAAIEQFGRAMVKTLPMRNPAPQILPPSGR